VDLDPEPAAVLFGLDGVVDGRRQAAARRLQLHHRPAVLAGGAAGLSGATLRIFYSFMVPIFGGRLWTTLSTCLADDPGLGDRLCRAEPRDALWIFLVLALLCGFGGGNFASSMSNIGFFFPKAEKGNALALNAGSATSASASCSSWCRWSSPRACSAPRRRGRRRSRTAGQLWLQNAGFIWVPFIIARVLRAWFGMNDIASAKASFKSRR
jgi:NNP family nitrate/nitrite transporter-like MFS transporter